jgi:hypothetical protein
MPFGKVDALAPLLTRTQSGRPVSIIFVGGMFGELLPNPAYISLYKNTSKLAVAFANSLARRPVTVKVYADVPHQTPPHPSSVPRRLAKQAACRHLLLQLGHPRLRLHRHVARRCRQAHEH